MALEDTQTMDNLSQAGDVLKNLNRANYPLTGYNFILRVEAMFDLPCKRITGITQEKDYEYIQEGGVNDYVHIREKPISKPFTFQVERYVGVDYYDPLESGIRLELPVLLLVNRTSGKLGITQMMMSFFGCVVTGKSYGEMDAEQSGLMVETTTIAYRKLEVIKM